MNLKKLAMGIGRRRDPTAREVFHRLMKTREEPIVQQIREGLLLCGIPVWRTRERIPHGCAPSEAGIPDLAGIIPPDIYRRYAIEPHRSWAKDYLNFAIPWFGEVKRPGRNEHRKSQVAFIEARHREGAVAGFWEGWDDVVASFWEIGMRLPQ